MSRINQEIDTTCRVYTMQELQIILGVSRAKIYRMARKGEFPVIVVGRSYRSPKVEFDNWLSSCGRVAA